MWKTTLFRRSVLITVAYFFYMILGCVGYITIEHFPTFDAAYFTMLILTRLGFGEIYPLSHAGRMFTFFMSFSGLILLGVTLATVIQAITAIESRRVRDPWSVDPIRSSPAPSVFICYRRDDSAAYAGRIYDRLGNVYGGSNVIVDVQTIDPGQDFVATIERTISCCDAVVALISRNWIGERGPQSGRRIDDENDFVRIELASALKANLTVVPVLLDGASMPNAADLPGDLQNLVRKQAHHVSHTSFDRDVDRLVDILDKITSPLREKRPN